MEAKNLSICVPGGCPNKCPFCVAEQHDNDYDNRYKSRPEEWKRRLTFAANNGVSSVLLTGAGEPLMNMPFIKMFSDVNASLQKPFEWIELQTSGVFLTDIVFDRTLHETSAIRFLRDSVGVSTISLSVCDIFSWSSNSIIMGIPLKYRYLLEERCELITSLGINLRLSMVMTDAYNEVTPEDIFNRAKELGASQITFRRMFNNGTGGVEDNWIKDHPYTRWDELSKYIKSVGSPLHRLSFGPMKYSVGGISTVADDDCMSTGENSSTIVRSLILRPDCKLYTHWGDSGSLVF